MDPLSQLLLPYIPMATIVVALVGLARETTPKIDGKVVLLVAAVAAVLVSVWCQLRGDPPMDWRKVLIDAPVIFIIAVGGTKSIQRLQDRKVAAEAAAAAAPVPPADVAPPVVVELPAPDDSRPL